jgi:hypothetical protein
MSDDQNAAPKHPIEDETRNRIVREKLHHDTRASQKS